MAMMADNAGLISVIVPVYNVAPYLREALDSLVHQTYKKLEIILVDDGSTDGSGEICEEYAAKDKRIRLIHQENKGLSTARNVGLTLMTGEAVAFFDPDDAYEATFFEKMMNALVSERLDQVICRYTLHRSEKKLQANKVDITFPRILTGFYGSVELLKGLVDSTVNVSVWNKLYRSSVWEEIRFPDGHVFEDNVVAFQVACKCERVQVIGDVLYLYRKRPGSITDTVSEKNIRDKLLARDNIVEFVRNNVPRYFTEEQLQKCIRVRLVVPLVSYVQIESKGTHDDGVRSDSLKKLLKERIIQVVGEIGLEHFNFKIKLAYWMICHCPWILRYAYAIYKPLRTFILRLRISVKSRRKL